ncbi:hypothetical protein [Alteribacter populi]|uniref:hypothetical protein n=1 Tax=Alteribacter populi TaxID=2011011 RepID=UPI000BBAA385|nr:hypothetical protein [Alteribacter populi]
MNHTKRRLLYTAASTVAVLLLFLVAYLFYLEPRLKEHQVLTDQKYEEEQLISQLEEEKQATIEENERRLETSTALQRKLPVIPLTDQFLLDVNMAEEVSGVRIMDLTLDKDEAVHKRLATEGTRDEADQTDNQENEGGAEDDGTDENTSITIGPERDLVEDEWRGDQIEAMYKQTATMDVRVDTYAHLVNFLDELDRLTRVVNIEYVYFKKEEDDEERMIVDGEDRLDFQVVASSYYYPPLVDLESEAPKMDYPSIDEREQPFLE